MPLRCAMAGKLSSVVLHMLELPFFAVELRSLTEASAALAGADLLALHIALRSEISAFAPQKIVCIALEHQTNYTKRKTNKQSKHWIESALFFQTHNPPTAWGKQPFLCCGNVPTPSVAPFKRLSHLLFVPRRGVSVVISWYLRRHSCVGCQRTDSTSRSDTDNSSTRKRDAV